MLGVGGSSVTCEDRVSKVQLKFYRNGHRLHCVVRQLFLKGFITNVANDVTYFEYSFRTVGIFDADLDPA